MIWLLLGLYVATVFAANWAIAAFGIVLVWPLPPLLAPAGVFFVGLAFPLRDFIQRVKGRAWSVGAILVGAGLSYVVSPRLAVASGVTFLVSELCDFAVYTPLARRFALAVAVSSVTALIVDSVLFLSLAFGSLEFLPGQVVGKAESLVVVLLLMAGWRARGLLARYA